MKTKIIALSVLSILLHSCAPKVVKPVAEFKKIDLTPELAAGRDMFENNCNKCHRLYQPTEFSKQDWAPILVRMQKKAKLDDTQMASISGYIYSQL